MLTHLAIGLEHSTMLQGLSANLILHSELRPSFKFLKSQSQGLGLNSVFPLEKNVSIILPRKI